MSLINDALKRARESQQNDPPRGATPATFTAMSSRPCAFSV